MKQLLLTAMLLTLCAQASARTMVDSGTNNAVFKLDGKVVSPVEASQGSDNHDIEKCTPIKGALSADGSEALAYKCKFVVRVINPKTGNSTWKSK